MTTSDWTNITTTTEVKLSPLDRVRVLFGARMRIIVRQRVDVELPSPARVIGETILIGNPPGVSVTKGGTP